MRADVQLALSSSADLWATNKRHRKCCGSLTSALYPGSMYDAPTSKHKYNAVLENFTTKINIMDPACSNPTRVLASSY